MLFSSQSRCHLSIAPPQALELDSDHVQALMNSAILMQETGRPELRPTAYERLFKVRRSLD